MPNYHSHPQTECGHRKEFYIRELALLQLPPPWLRHTNEIAKMRLQNMANKCTEFKGRKVKRASLPWPLKPQDHYGEELLNL
jgi:hypothetical protein